MPGNATHVGNSVYVKAKHRFYPYANLGASVNVSVWDNSLEPAGYRKQHYFGGSRPLLHFGVPLYDVAVTSFENDLGDCHHKFTLWDGKTTIRVDRTGDDDAPHFELSFTGLEDEEYAADTLSLNLNLDEAKSFIQGFVGRESHKCICCGRPVPTFRHLIRVTADDPAEKVSNLYRMMRGLSARYAAAECRIDPRTAQFAADVDSNNLWAGDICTYNNASCDVWQVPSAPGKGKVNFKSNVAAGKASDVKGKVVREDETDESIFDDPSVVNLVRYGSVKGQVGLEKKSEQPKLNPEPTERINKAWSPNGSLMDDIERRRKRIRPTTLCSKGSETPAKKAKMLSMDKADSIDSPAASQRSSPDLFIEENSTESYTQVDTRVKMPKIKSVICRPQPMKKDGQFEIFSQEVFPEVIFESESEEENSGDGEEVSTDNMEFGESQIMGTQSEYAATPENSKKYKSHSRKLTEGSNANLGEDHASGDGGFPLRRKLEY